MTDGGADGGAARDAGRVLTVVDRAIYIQPDGGVEEFPRTGEVVNALFYLADGGLLRLPMSGDGGVFVAENAPPGPWLIETIPANAFKAYFDVSGDSQDITSSVYLGRPGAPVTRSEFFFLDLMTRPWGDPNTDFLQVSSRSAGSRFTIYPEPAPGSVVLYGQFPPSDVHGTAIRPSDDARVSQFQADFRDGGAVSFEITGSAVVGGVSLPGQFASGTLAPPISVGSARATLDAGAIATVLGGTVSGCEVRVQEQSGDLRLIGAPYVFTIEFSSLAFDSYQFDVPHPSGQPVSAQVQCSRSTNSAVPTIDGGLETSDAGVLRAGSIVSIFTVDHLSLDGGVASPPLVAIPQSILVDGLSSPGSVSGSPAVSWTTPPTGSVTYYQVLIRRVTRTANSFVRSLIAFLFTTGTQIRIPPGLLVTGERYVFEVSAIQTGALDPARPWKPVLPVSGGAGVSTIVVAN